MMLTVSPARSGHGLVIRDTNTRHQVLVDGPDLIDVGTTLLNYAAMLATQPKRPPRKGPTS